MNWSADIEEVHRRCRLAEECCGPDAVARHRAEGKLTVRECIARLLDPGSFQEVASWRATRSTARTGSSRHSRHIPTWRVSARSTGVRSRWSARITPSRAARTRAAGGGRRKGGQGGFIEDLSRLGGKVVGVIACNPTHGGVVDVKAAFRREIEAAGPGMRTRPGLKARLGVRP